MRAKSGGRVLRGGNIVYDVSSRMGGVSSGGLGLIVQLVKRLRVAERIDERVRVLKRHLPYRESDHVLNLIYNVMSGGVCLQDVKSRREDVSYLESVGARKIPAPSTEGDFLRRFKQEDVLALQEAFNESRLQVWQSQAAEMGKRATIDVDGTTAETTGCCKEGMDLNYKGQWGYGPLVVSLAETNEVLYTFNRPAVNHQGNSPTSVTRVIPPLGIIIISFLLIFGGCAWENFSQAGSSFLVAVVVCFEPAFFQSQHLHSIESPIAGGKLAARDLL